MAETELLPRVTWGERASSRAERPWSGCRRRTTAGQAGAAPGLQACQSLISHLSPCGSATFALELQRRISSFDTKTIGLSRWLSGTVKRHSHRGPEDHCEMLRADLSLSRSEIQREK